MVLWNAGNEPAVVATESPKQLTADLKTVAGLISDTVNVRMACYNLNSMQLFTLTTLCV